MSIKFNSPFKHLVPANVKGILKKSIFWLRYTSNCTNVYHCCVHKTASQWMQSLLCDSRVYRYSGLTLCPNGQVYRGGYTPINTTSEPFPEKTIAGSLHISFSNFLAIPKPERYKAFFVMRDPRDIVISYYFSAKYSHVPNPKIIEERNHLNNLSLTEGILYAIDILNSWGLFAALRSWMTAFNTDKNIRLFRFEELTAPNNFEVFKELLLHCDIRIPDNILIGLLQDYSFSKITNGRQQGQEDRYSHLRKGVPSDWKNYFNDEIAQKFEKATGDLVMQLGYK